MTLADGLESIFHEPSRLAVMTELTGRRDGVSFVDLKETCALTDGNLSRHITALEKAGAVRVEKSFVGAKPRTTLFATPKGRKEFLEYLESLEAVLKNALKKTKSGAATVPGALAALKPVK